ncbi:MAG: DUF58 domain-containing protein, partial [Nitrospinaceae bacterium]|nr:DUF58 domain-containing protein [Nitrospinaceae bacterium]NIR55011.1 DUF58 domain-containing protein [Nitrospinaceae bacterium]NIS85530.1 DUF58 domain-containing protein [Nitrospinaceae bacterium]NIT82364.1 DUF58 domain-containing protein [Nitrospinaceae bacterium]NIU44580.1 DUF58 domain-containing protein [Nitrospinaceae bacterium]
IWNIIRTILQFQPEGRGTNLVRPLEYLLNLQKRKTVTFFISDFLAEGYENAVKLAKQKHDLIAIRIIDPREWTLPPVGLLQVQDAETGEILLVDTGNRQTLRQYEALCRKKHLQVKRFLNSIGVDLIEIRTDRSLTEPIIRYFKMREKKH